MLENHCWLKFSLHLPLHYWKYTYNDTTVYTRQDKIGSSGNTLHGFGRTAVKEKETQHCQKYFGR